MTTETKLKIVKVQYFNQASDMFQSRDYTYYSEDKLKVGDIVTVPVKDTTGKAKVTVVDVPESEIEKFKDRVKVIPAGSILNLPAKDLFSSNNEPSPGPYGVQMDESPEKTAEFVEIPVIGKVPCEVISDTLGTVKPETALININPLNDPGIQPLVDEVNKIKDYAVNRVVANDADVKVATEDLATMATLKKTLAGKYKEWTGPINEHLAKVRDAFNQITNPLSEADTITRKKILDYRAEVEKRRQKTEEINRMRAEAAAKEAAMNDGEISESVKEIPVPQAPAQRVRTDIGTLGTMKVKKWKITDMNLIPRQYLLVNESLITQLVKKGIAEIPGIEIYTEDTLTVRGR